MKYDTVIFDLDGTLLNTLEDLMDSVNFALEKNGMPLRTFEEVRHFVGNGVEKLMERAIPYGKENPFFKVTFADFKEHYLIHCNDKTAAYKNIPELLSQLKNKGYKMAIVSNKYMNAVKELNDIYFKDYIQVAIGESAGIRKKPAPDTVIEAMRQLDSKPENCIYAGDSEVDYQTAVNSGIPCISCLWGFRTKDELLESGVKNDIFIHDPLEILEVLEN